MYINFKIMKNNKIYLFMALNILKTLETILNICQ